MKGKKKYSGLKKGIIAILLITVFVITGYNLYIMYKNIDIESDYEYQTQELVSSTERVESVDKYFEESKTRTDIIEKVSESVVGISKLKTTGGSILNNVSSEELGLGTGIVVSSDGYILSNSHVTGEKYSTCYVTINENIYTGNVVWSDTNLDLSITKVNAKNLRYAELGDSSILKVGETCFAIGNPIGYEFRKTVTSGIISALNRTIKISEDATNSYISNLIQTDATINPGNSGGPLINVNGEVIGINTVKITSAEGIGFAIPINVIKPVVQSYRDKGSFDEAILGIYAYDEEVAKYLNLEDKISSGIYVSSITVNGPSSRTDLKVGDIITNIDGKELNTMNDLREYIYTKVPGDTVVLCVARGNSETNINIVLGKK